MYIHANYGVNSILCSSYQCLGLQSVTNLIFADCTMTGVAIQFWNCTVSNGRVSSGRESIFIYRGPVCYPRMPDLARFFTTAPAPLDLHQPSPFQLPRVVMWGLSLYCCVSHRCYTAEQRLMTLTITTSAANVCITSTCNGPAQITEQLLSGQQTTCVMCKVWYFSSLQGPLVIILDESVCCFWWQCNDAIVAIARFFFSLPTPARSTSKSRGPHLKML